MLTLLCRVCGFVQYLCNMTYTVTQSFTLLKLAVVIVIIIIITRTLRERKPPPTPKFHVKVIRDLHPDFQINLDLDVCWICPKMLWMHYLVGVSHFAKCGTNRLLIIWIMPTHHLHLDDLVDVAILLLRVIVLVSLLPNDVMSNP